MTREIKFRCWDKRFKKFDYGGGALLLRHNSDDFEEVQQYTGLRDKNGKEIYEGDIVRFNDDDNFLFKVVWASKYGSWYVVPLGDYYNEAPLGKSEEACEVIGSIYENPELLTNK